MSDIEGKWKLEEVFPGSNSGIFQLQSASADKTLIQKFASKKSNREAAAKLLTMLDSIAKLGIPRSIEKKDIKRLDGDIVEIRVPNAVIRAISYQRSGEPEIVILDIERTHQGSGNMKRYIETAKPKAEAAKFLLATRKGR